MTTLTEKQQVEQQQIIESGNGFDAYIFARDVPGADIKALEQVVIDRGYGFSACRFARDIPGAGTKALEQVVIERGDGFDACCFAEDIPNADIRALEQVGKQDAENPDLEAAFDNAKPLKKNTNMGM